MLQVHRNRRGLDCGAKEDMVKKENSQSWPSNPRWMDKVSTMMTMFYNNII